MNKFFKIYLLITMCFLTFGCNQNKTLPIIKEEDSQNEEKITYPIVKKISLIATGDGLLHNSVYKSVYNKDNDSFDFSSQLTMIKDIVSNYDIAYYNQETLFGGKQTDMFTDPNHLIGYSSYPYFNSPSEFGDAMIDAGFNTVSLASNHSADCRSKSKECITNSVNYWKSKKDVLFSGLNDSIEMQNTIPIKEKNGITYTMLNYTTTLNGLDSFIKEEYLVNQYDEEKVKKDIESIKNKVDVIIVAMHWHTGAEYSFNVTQKNQEIASYLSSLGVDIILGTYSHCLQPFDIINDTVVFYSLGNFISNQGVLVNSIGYKGIVGALATMDIVKTINEDGSTSISIENIGSELIYTYKSDKKEYLVIPFSKMKDEYNSNYKKIHEDYSNVLKSLNKNIKIIQAN